MIGKDVAGRDAAVYFKTYHNFFF